MTTRLAITLTVTLCTSAAYTMQVGRLAGARHATSGVVTRHAVSAPVPGRTAPRVQRETNPPVRDLYGNDVSDAVARYKFDPEEGSAYEEHSPQTELPKLKPPTT